MLECSPAGKALILTAFIKMTRHSVEIRGDVRKVFELHKDHWDIEIQQRSCEYLLMLDYHDQKVGSSAEEQEDAKEFINGALEKMPNFSEDIQNNNVLTKRILALKVKDGLHMNLEEAQRELKQNMQKISGPGLPVDY
jgi:hypothetical protein